MYFSGTKPSDILLCIRRNDIRTYGKYLEDTNESIDLMEDLESLLKSSNNISTSMIFEWLKSNLKMRSSEQGNSIYKAFLCLQSDEIFNLRISNHYSNTNATRTSWNYNGSPDSEIHIIIEEIRNPILVIRGNSILSQDTLLFDKPVLVNSYTLEDLRNPEKIHQFTSDIIKVLNYGIQSLERTTVLRRGGANLQIRNIRESFNKWKRKMNVFELFEWLNHKFPNNHLYLGH